MAKAGTKYKGQRPESARLAYTALPFVAIILLQLLGLILPAGLGWGFNFWRLIPTPGNIIILAAALCLMIPAVNRSITAFATQLVQPLAQAIRRLPAVVMIAITTPVLFAVFYIFRSRALVYGDGYIVLESHTNLAQPIDLALFFMKPLSVLFDRTVFGILTSIIDASPEHLLALIKTGGGVLGFWALCFIARLLTNRLSARWLIVIGALTSGAFMLFWGYIENYTWATALSLWSLAFSIGHLKQKNKIWPAVLTGVLACGFHLLALPYLVVALLVSVDRKLKLFESPRFRLLSWGATVLAVFVAVVMAVTVGRQYLAGLWPMPNDPYWLLSGAHLIDMVNQVFLVAPLGIMVLLFIITRRQLAGISATREYRLLLLTAILTFMAAFWINPHLGAPRDWDLLSFFGFPASLLGAYLLARRAPGKEASTRQLTAVIIVAVVLIAPNLHEKTNLSLAVARLDNLLWQDAHYQMDYRQAERCLPWSWTLRVNAGERQRAIKYLHRHRQLHPDDFWTLFGLGDIYLRQEQYDSAYFYLNRCLTLRPDNTDMLDKLSQAAEALGKTDKAIRHLQRVLELKPGNAEMNSYVAVMLCRADRTPEALPFFHQAYSRAPQAITHMVNLGTCFYNLKQFDSASFYLERVMASPVDVQIKLTCGELLIYSAIACGDRRKAQDMLTSISRLAPNSSKITELREVVESGEIDTTNNTPRP